MTKETKTLRLVKLMQRRWVSPLSALNHCGLMSLSQRVGELRRSGMHIADMWVKDKDGRNVCKQYKIVSGKGC